MDIDEAITKRENDLLGRDRFAKSTAHALLKMTHDGTYTVGLFGKWGADVGVSEVKDRSA